MEASFLDKPIFPNKQMKNPKGKTQYHHHQQQQVSRRACNIIMDQNFAPPYQAAPVQYLDMMMQSHGGDFLMMHGHRGDFLKPHDHGHHHHHLQPFSLSSASSLPPPHRHRQPPLLPLPVVLKPAFLSLPPPGRSHSSLPYVSPPKTTNNKKHNTNNKKAIKSHPNTKPKGSATPNDVVAESGKQMGPDPVNLPKDMTRILVADMNNISFNNSNNDSSVFISLSPPPSSLPLPKFSLRQQQPKLSCTTEADDGAATNNLCRLLRLR